MSKLFSYNIPQVIRLAFDSTGTGWLMNYPVDVTRINISKTVTSLIQVLIRNIDSKVSTIPAGSTVQVQFFDKAGNIYMAKDLVLADVKQGLYNFTVSSSDLLSWEETNLYYLISIRDAYGILSPLYTDRNYSSTGVVNVSRGPIPIPPLATTVLGSELLARNGSWYSSAFAGPSAITNPSAQATAAIYQTVFLGSVTVQGTLESLPTSDDSQWFDVATYTTAIATTGPIPLPFVGNFTFIRFRVTPFYNMAYNISGSIDQIIFLI